MAQKVTDMISKISRFGTVKGNKYKVIFGGMVGNADSVMGKIGIPLGGDLGTAIRESNLEIANPDITGKFSPIISDAFNSRFSLSCDSVNMPGRSMATSNFKTIGPSREMPYGKVYGGDISMTFLLGQDMLERKIFETWMDSISNPKNNRFKYYDDYVCNCDILMFDELGTPVYKSRLVEVYPKEVGAIQLSNEGSDMAKQNVTLHYRKYIPINLDFGELSDVYDGLNSASHTSRQFMDALGVDDGGVLDQLTRVRETFEKYGDDGRVVSKSFKSVGLGGF